MFIESPPFPQPIALRSTGGPGWSTTIVAMNSGYEQRNQPWSQARHSYEVAHVARRPEYFKLLQDFFQIAQGQTHGFRVRDPRDYQVAAGEGFFTMLTATTFQMVKRYTVGAQTIDRDIRKPASGTVTVTGGSGVSVNYTTGVVTVSSGTPTAWIGNFDVPCRFATDQMQGDIIDKHGDSGEFLIEWSSIALIEIRE